MNYEIAKSFVSLLPFRWQQGLKRKYFAYKIKKGEFISDEPEYNFLEKYVFDGDWVIDIGANIGHYTLKFSKLVGNNGRVFALEPVPDTFELLAANAQLFPFKNVTLLNVAASEHPSVISMEIPFFKSGLKNFYMATITDSKTGLEVFCLPIDSLHINKSVRIIKIDAEGHELQILRGMKNMLLRDKPLLIVETNSSVVFEYLSTFGYIKNKLLKSPNYFFQQQ